MVELVEAPSAAKLCSSVAGGFLLYACHLPYSLYVLLAVIFFDVVCGGMFAIDEKRFSGGRAVWGFFRKMIGCLVMIATVKLTEAYAIELAGLTPTISMTEIFTGVCIVFEAGSVAQSYRKLKMPGAEFIDGWYSRIINALSVRQMDQATVSAKLDAAKQAGEASRPTVV